MQSQVAALLPSVEKLDNAELTPQDRDAARRDPDVAAFVSMLSRCRGDDTPDDSNLTDDGGMCQQQQVQAQDHQAVPSRSPSRPQSKPPLSPSGAVFQDPQALPQSRGGVIAAVHRTPSAVAVERDLPGQRRRKNVLYAVMALITELDEEDLVYVKREIEQRMGSKCF